MLLMFSSLPDHTLEPFGHSGSAIKTRLKNSSGTFLASIGCSPTKIRAQALRNWVVNVLAQARKYMIFLVAPPAYHSAVKLVPTASNNHPDATDWPLILLAAVGTRASISAVDNLQMVA